MKNKLAVYILGILVVVVWGLIVLRVTQAASGNEDSNSLDRVSVETPKEAMNDFAPIKDTATLKLNYKNPFELSPVTAAHDTQSVPLTKLVHTSASSVNSAIQKPAPINWNLIKYSGYIRNPHTKKLIALVSVDGKGLMLSEGESSGQVKLLKNLKDSIKINFQNHIKFITVNQANP